MEVWMRDPKGPAAPKGKEGLAERDVRMFRDPWYQAADGNEPDILAARSTLNALSREKKSSDNLAIGGITARPLPEADLLAMFDARQAEALERSYVDALHNRNGTLVPSSLINTCPSFEIPIREVDLASLRHFQQFAKVDNEEVLEKISVQDLDQRIAAAVANKETYEFAPTADTPKGINCNTGATKYLLESGMEKSAILPATPFQVGLHADMKIRNHDLVALASRAGDEPGSIRDVDETKKAVQQSIARKPYLAGARHLWEQLISRQYPETEDATNMLQFAETEDGSTISLAQALAGRKSALESAASSGTDLHGLMMKIDRQR